MRTSALPLLLLAACSTSQRAPSPGDGASDYLYLWTGSADSTAPDFLAVLDVRADTGRYGALVTTLAVPGLHNGPHHTEHAMPADGQLFANGFTAGQSFIFDLRDGAHPRLAGQFSGQAGFTHPHSFLRLSNGNVLSTFQMSHGAAGMAPGGLVELTPAGQVVRSSSAFLPGVDPGLRPYSAGIVAALDRVVTTTTDMDPKSPFKADQLQIWRLSDLKLLHTITLPQGPRGDEGDLTAEPRVLEDGRTVLVSTFNCGLYLLEGLEGESPAGRLVASLPMKDKDSNCAIPAVAGHFLLITVPTVPGVVSLDISDPAHPREASRLTLDSTDVPHWISLEPNTRRVVITGFGSLLNRVLIARFDSASGALALDRRFREPGSDRPGYAMSGRTWPHGGSAPGIPHGAVFSRP